MQCPHCFREMNTPGVCPFCGYDGSGQEKKYPLALRPGSILNGRYILGHVLGQGGFGITYIAQDDQTKERVAIKEYFPAELAGRADSGSVQVYSADRAESFAYGREQFLEEAETLAAFIGSENIVRIYSYFEENDTAYYCMEYVDGLPLNRYMAAHGGRLSPAEADRLLLPLMEALEAVHAKGIVHRDIAPDNILVDRNGTAKLIDFGAARYSTGEKSKSLDVILKHGFAPYEQYMRRGRQGPWTDVYALAATYYYAITGKVPAESVERREEDRLIPPGTLGAKLSAAQEDVLLKALAVNAPERIQNMGDFRRAVLEAASGPQAEQPQREDAARPGQEEAHGVHAEAEQAGKAAKKRSRLLLLLLPVLAAVIALAVFGAARNRDRDEAYREASALLDAGDYARAAGAFAALGDYRDAAEQAENAARMRDYLDAVKLLEAEQYAQAAEAFAALGDYRDAAEQAENAARMQEHLEALALLKAGDYEAAYALLEELGDRETIAASRYDRAMVQIDKGDYDAALRLLEGIDYKDSAVQTERIALLKAQVGSHVFFGEYEQDNDASNGKESIEWLVLAKEADRVLIISRYALDAQPYNTSKVSVIWETCTLRKWLNEEFYNAAFSAEEKEMIALVTLTMEGAGSHDTTDPVFLLQTKGLVQYFPNDEARRCEPTKYAVANGCEVDRDNGCCPWWRAGDYNHASRHGQYVTASGFIPVTYYMDPDPAHPGGVRPAVWIRTES